jgi:cysteine desulfurase
MIGATAQRASVHSAAVGFDAEAPPRIHLDANANAPATAAVKHAVLQALDTGANPSSAHAAGEEARVVLAKARDAVAGLCEGVFPEDVIFTSGCTESNNLIVASAAAARATLITSAVEHPSVLRPAEAFAATGGSWLVLPVDGDGLLDLAILESSLQATSGPIFLSIQAGNSETGVLQPLEAIARMAARRGDVLFHTDAAQAFGKAIIQIGRDRGPDVVSVSGHKLHGPMGVGALLLREGEDRLGPLLLGGDQERGLRAGTQALPLIAGFGAACAGRGLAFAAEVSRMRALRDRLERGVRVELPEVCVNGGGAPRLPNTSNFRFPGLDAMSLIALLDAEGVLVSQGSACHSRRPEPSPVLVAMGLQEDEAFASVRFSMSPLNTEAEIDSALPIIVEACRRLGMRP